MYEGAGGGGAETLLRFAWEPAELLFQMSQENTLNFDSTIFDTVAKFRHNGQPSATASPLQIVRRLSLKSMATKQSVHNFVER